MECRIPIVRIGSHKRRHVYRLEDDHEKNRLGFYEHAETPGLGGEVDNPLWKAQWKDKKIFDEDWQLQLEVVKGRVNLGHKSAIHQVDGLSGATITARGVKNLLRFWLGESGFAKYLTKLRKKGIKNG